MTTSSYQRTDRAVFWSILGVIAVGLAVFLMVQGCTTPQLESIDKKIDKLAVATTQASAAASVVSGAAAATGVPYAGIAEILSAMAGTVGAMWIAHRGGVKAALATPPVTPSTP